MILFLDFDGVLHPSCVYVGAEGPYLANTNAGERLFMWVGILEGVLADHPDVRLVLSTNWCRRQGFARTRDRLPEGLRQRVIGSTFHSKARDWYDNATRYAQIVRYLALAQTPGSQWLAIDDLHEGEDLDDWPAAYRNRLILTDCDLGLSHKGTVEALRTALEAAR